MVDVSRLYRVIGGHTRFDPALGQSIKSSSWGALSVLIAE
jgi:hypothetical protein